MGLTTVPGADCGLQSSVAIISFIVNARAGKQGRNFLLLFFVERDLRSEAISRDRPDAHALSSNALGAAAV
jgi:hypothetical protein